MLLPYASGGAVGDAGNFETLSWHLDLREHGEGDPEDPA